MIDEIKKTIALEGGYVNDPLDSGSETKYGISKRAFPNEDIANLTEDRATEIYQDHYWNPCGLDKYSYKPFRWKVFDIAVNMGVSTAQNFLMQLGSIDSPEAVWNLCELQMKKYVAIVIAKPTQVKFLKGWTLRAFDRGENL